MKSNIYWEDNDEIHILYFRKWYELEEVLSFELTEKQFEDTLRKHPISKIVFIEYRTSEWHNNELTTEIFNVADTYEETITKIKEELEQKLEDHYYDQLNYYKSLYEYFIEEE